MTSAVVHVSNNGYFKMIDTLVTDNFAFSSSVSQIFDSSISSIVENSNIYSNTGMSLEDLLTELNVKCTYLCFLSEKFKQYLIENSEVYSISRSQYCFQLIIGALTIQNGTDIYQQNKVLDSFQSTVIISDTTIHDFTEAETAIKITSSSVNLTNVEIYNAISLLPLPLLRIAFESTVGVNGLKYYDSQATFLTFLTSSAKFQNVEIYN